MHSTKISFDIYNTDDCKSLGIFDFNISFRKCKELKISGIYSILCKTTGKYYIGSSKKLCIRFSEHRVMLQNKNHYNKKLQNAFDKYGKDDFVFKILEVCDNTDRNFLIKREQLYLNYYFPTDEKFRLNSLNLKKNADGGLTGGIRKHKRKKVSVFDLNMNFIEEVLGVNETHIKYKAHVHECCKGLIYSSKGYIFRYSDNINLIRKKKKGGFKKGEVFKNAKKINQFDLEGNFIKEWRCAGEAAKELNLNESQVRKNINHPEKCKFVKKFIFSYNNTVMPQVSNRVSGYNLYNLSGELLKELSSAQTIQLELGINKLKFYNVLKKEGIIGNYKIEKVHD